MESCRGRKDRGKRRQSMKRRVIAILALIVFCIGAALGEGALTGRPDPQALSIDH